MNFSTLPNLVALAVLVGVFRAISRKATTKGLHLWLAGWALVLLHFIAQFLDTGEGIWERVTATISLNSLLLAAIVFLISVLPSTGGKLRQVLLVLCTAIPAVAYATGVACDITSRNYYYSVIGSGVLLMLVVVWSQYDAKIGRKLAVASGWLLTAIVASLVVGRNPEVGFIGILAAVNFAVAFLYWKRYKRYSAGVMTAVGGFVLWGAVFPTAVLLQAFFPSQQIGSGAWNIPEYLVAVGMILTLLEEQIQTSNYFAFHDELTGLPNRRLLHDRLERALAYAHRNKTKLVVLTLDLNRFKEINDTYGHRAGDLVLREVVARLARCIRADDTMARSGGDEFTIVGRVAGIEGAEALRSTLQLALSSPINIEGTDVQTGLSIGLALYPDDGSDLDRLCATADQAMYTVKRAAQVVPANEAASPSAPDFNEALSSNNT